MTEPPPLPDTDDPHALLGIAEDADETAVRKAYAARIKLYRPDRHPEAFQRIQAALDQLRRAPTASLVLATAHHVPRTQAPDVEATVDRIHGAIIAAAAALLPDRRADAIVGELLADRAWWQRVDDDREHAVLTWRTASALSWLTAVEDMRRRLNASKWVWGADPDVDLAEIDIACAAALRAKGAIPRELVMTMVASCLRQQDLSSRARALVTSLQNAPYSYLDLFDRGFAGRPDLARQVAARLAAQTDDGRLGDADLSPAREGEIRMVLDDQTRVPEVKEWYEGVRIASIVGFVVCYAVAKSGELAVAGAVIAAVVVTAVAAYVLSRRSSRMRTRRAMARAFTRLGITVDGLSDFMRSKALAAVGGDLLGPALAGREPGLSVLGAFAAWAATLAEDGGPPVDSSE